MEAIRSSKQPVRFGLCVLLFFAAATGHTATVPSVVGTWNATGTVTAKASGALIKYLKQQGQNVSSLSHSARFADQFTFDQFNFASYEADTGTWTQAGGKVTAQLDNDELAATLQDAFDASGLPISVNTVSNSWIMSIDKNGNLKGTVSIVVDLIADVSTTGAFTITEKGSYSGKMSVGGAAKRLGPQAEPQLKRAPLPLLFVRK
jgi:hypothetical protein